MFNILIVSLSLVGPLVVAQPVPQPKLEVAKPKVQPTLQVVPASGLEVVPLQGSQYSVQQVDTCGTIHVARWRPSKGARKAD